MNKKFLLEISSDLSYEGMIINISYKNDIVAILNQDMGVDNIEIKIFLPINDECWNFLYSDFMETLEKAKNLLIQVNK